MLHYAKAVSAISMQPIKFEMAFGCFYPIRSTLRRDYGSVNDARPLYGHFKILVQGVSFEPRRSA